MNICCYCSGITAERHLCLIWLTGLKGLLIQVLFFQTRLAFEDVTLIRKNGWF